VNYFRAVAFLNSELTILLLALPILSLTRFSASVHHYHGISHALLSSVRSTSHVELLGHVLSIAWLLRPMAPLLLVSTRCAHRLALMVLLGLIESVHLGIGPCFYFGIVYDKVVVVVIRDNVCYYFRLAFALGRSLLLWWIRLVRLRPGLFLLLTLSVSVRPTDALLLLTLRVSGAGRSLEDYFRAIDLLLFKRICISKVYFIG
jgi:hypothetical protein